MGILCPPSPNISALSEARDTNGNGDASSMSIKTPREDMFRPLKKKLVEGRCKSLDPTTTPVIALPANSKRVGYSVYNDPGAGLGSRFFLMNSKQDGARLTTTFFSVALDADEYFEAAPVRLQTFTEDVYIVWSSIVAGNKAQFTEYVEIDSEEDNF